MGPARSFIRTGRVRATSRDIARNHATRGCASPLALYWSDPYALARLAAVAWLAHQHAAAGPSSTSATSADALTATSAAAPPRAVDEAERARELSWHPGGSEFFAGMPRHPTRKEYEALLRGDLAAALDFKLANDSGMVGGSMPSSHEVALRELVALGADWQPCCRCDSETCRCAGGPRGWLAVNVCH